MTIGNAFSVPTIQNQACNDASSCFTLTPNSNWQQGAVWDMQSIDLSLAFDATFCMFLGNNDSGADGFAFIIRDPSSNTYGDNGGGLGYGNGNGNGIIGIFPSVAIEFDTYYNPSCFDISDDHTQLVLNGNVSNPPAVAAIPLLANSGNVEDNNFHTARVVWDPSSFKLTMYFDGVIRFTYSNNLVANVFSGNNNVLWGFTASTGGSMNLQQICFPVLTIDIQDETICQTDTTYIHYFHDDLSKYSWKDPNQNTFISWDNTLGTQLIDTGFFATIDGDYVLTVEFNNHIYTKVVRVEIVELPVSISKTLCLNQGNTNLLGFFPNPPLDGTWTGPSNLANGIQGQFNPLTNLEGDYFYTSDSSQVCPIDFYTLQIEVQKVIFHPSITLVPCSETSYNISFNPSSNLGNPTYNFEWILNGSNLLSTLSQQIVTVNANSQLEIGLISNDAFACAFDTLINLNFISNPQLNLGNDISFCQNSSQIISATSSWTSYLWSDGTTNSSIQVTNTGTYWCEVNSSNSCVFRDSIDVLVNPLPQILLEPFDSVSCAPLVNQFNVSSDLSGVKYYWFFSDGNVFANQSVVNKTFTIPGYYDILIKATSLQMCESTLNLNSVIHVLETPIADFSYSITQTNSQFKLSFFSLTSNFSTILWDFNNIDSSSILNPFYYVANSFDESGLDFVVTLIAANSECSDTVKKIIDLPDPLIYYVPNSFTPDGNELNNTFLPILTSGIDITTYHLTIFNRWGEMLFESFDSEIGWDGTYGNRLVEEDSYTWTIDFSEIKTKESHSINGTVSILK